jgi:hypothetical protein
MPSGKKKKRHKVANVKKKRRVVPSLKKKSSPQLFSLKTITSIPKLLFNPSVCVIEKTKKK